MVVMGIILVLIENGGDGYHFGLDWISNKNKGMLMKESILYTYTFVIEITITYEKCWFHV